MILKRDKALMQVARDEAKRSDDFDTHTGAAVRTGVNPSTVILASANKIAKGVAVIEDRQQRPEKYAWIAHAEESLISHAARYGIALAGATMAVTWFPCAPCARMIINAGIVTILVDREAYQSRKDDPRYGFATSREMLDEAGVKIIFMDAEVTGNAEASNAGSLLAKVGWKERRSKLRAAKLTAELFEPAA
jgi:dCMP deaminase